MKYLERWLDSERSDCLYSLYMFFYFFLVITTFWVLKPIKKSLFIEFYDKNHFEILNLSLSASQTELLAKVANMVVAIGALFLFSKLSTKFKGYRLTAIFCSLFSLALIFLGPTLSSGNEVAIWIFYLFGDLFSSLMVVLFFAYLNDSVSSNISKKLYGPIGLGGILGGIVGTTFVKVLIADIPIYQWIMICIFIIGLIALCAYMASLYVPHQDLENITNNELKNNNSEHGFLASAKTVFQSKYLVQMACLIGLYEMVSTIMDFQLSTVVSHYYDGNSIGVFFSNMYAITNWVSLFSQIVLTNLILRKSGVENGLIILPILILVASFSFVIFPFVLVAGSMAVIDNGLNYSINQSAKEALYVPLPSHVKYQAKGFIDIFIMRCSKVLAIVLSFSLSFYFKDFESVRWLSLCILLLCSVWLFLVFQIGDVYKELTGVKRVARVGLREKISAFIFTGEKA